jgi:membrane-associated phospholipid phosphatase
MIPAVARGRWLRATGLLGIALAVGAWSRGGRGRRLDEEGFRIVNDGWGPAADRVFRAVTELGSIWASVGAWAVLRAGGRARAADRAMAAALLAWTAGQGLKRLFGRARPYEAEPDGARLLIARPPAASWPSSHPAVLGAFAAVAARELGLGGGARAGLAALTATVGLSRVYLGVHYPADVVGGILLGRAVAEVAAGPGGPAGGAG